MSFKSCPRLALMWRSTSLLVSLCAGLVVAACSSDEGWLFDELVTVELKGPVTTYTLRAPFGAFYIRRDNDIDYANYRVSGLTSTGMYWHFESGEPWWLWLRNQDIPLDEIDDVELSANISPIFADFDVAKSAKEVYFDVHLNNTNSSTVPKLQRKIWNNSVSEYKDFDTTYYVIDEREPFDGSVIVCMDSAVYCSLRGARVRDTLRLDDIFVYKDDVANWKEYQHKAQMWVEQAIVDVKPTEEEKPNRWLFWRK